MTVACSVVGLAKLGASMAAAMASRGHLVIGFDVNDGAVEAINQGRAPVAETGLAELIESNRERLQATTSLTEAVLQSDVTFVVVPTPSDANGGFSLEHAAVAFEGIGRALAGKPDYHLVVLISTVLPGATRYGLLPILEDAAGKRCGDDIGLCYGPEFIALGSVIRDLLNPDVLLIGESDQRAGDLLEDLYKTVCENDPSVQRMNFVNAELTKIAVNTFVTTKISYANMLADMCDRLPGADVDVVTAAVGSDSRIGVKYLKGALGYGGPCFPRDNVAFATLAHRIGARADLAEATDRINRYQVERIAAAVKRNADGNAVVGILGLSYKPDTSVIVESQGVALAKSLTDSGYSVVIYDPFALGSACAVLGDRVRAADSAEACVRAADVVVITTPWPEFRELSPRLFDRNGVKPVIVDCWRILPSDRFLSVAEVVYPGRWDTRLAGNDTETVARSVAS